MTMDFTYPEIIRLINVYKKHPIIYDVNYVGYNDRKKRSIAWHAIGLEMKTNPEACRRKLESLLSSCRREKKKIENSKTRGVHTYVPKWRFWNEFKFLRGLGDDEEDPLGSVPVDVVKAERNTESTTVNMLASKNESKKPPPKKRPVQEDDEYTATGAMVEAKLKNMTKTQRLYAEGIIRQILYKGLLFQLGPSSKITDTEENQSGTVVRTI